MPGHKNDPTRKAPAGSRTETKIAEESALGSDNSVDQQPPVSTDRTEKQDPKS